MLKSQKEYQKMAIADEKLWWYKILHRYVAKGLRDINFGDAILDLGCGTGGQLNYLKNLGFNNLYGGDISEFALQECKQKGLEVETLDILQLKSHKFYQQKFSVIICCDVLYFVPKEQRLETIKDLLSMLQPQGKLILNLPVYNCFAGIHDLSVGISERINPKEFIQNISGLPVDIVQKRFWPFFLSPLIYLSRFMQRQTLKKNPGLKPDSDIDIPSNLVNTILYQISYLESKIPIWPSFGSSMFLSLKLQ